jgi:hypothetical protein
MICNIVFLLFIIIFYCYCYHFHYFCDFTWIHSVTTKLKSLWRHINRHTRSYLSFDRYRRESGCRNNVLLSMMIQYLIWVCAYTPKYNNDYNKINEWKKDLCNRISGWFTSAIWRFDDKWTQPQTRVNTNNPVCHR